MAYSYYDRLSALDATFLDLEDDNVHMHVGALAIFEGGELARPDGGIDFARVRRLAGPSITRNQRFRQRLEHVPLLGHPVWVDDARFQLDYHLRHTALPEPGDERQLKRLFGRLMSQKLDVHKPLWEIWFVEGLAGGRFAVITKVHHSMIDGVSGVDLLATLMDPEAEAEALRADLEGAAGSSRPWLARAAPSPWTLLADEGLRRAALPLAALRAGRDAVAHPDEAVHALRDALEGLREILTPGLIGASPTPLNGEIGPHRRFDWLQTGIADTQEVRKRIGGTLNDVALATVAGAMRHFLVRRSVSVDDLVFRAQVPVSVRAADEHGLLGNRIALLLADLPVAEPDRRRRYERVVETTAKLKASRQVHGGQLLERLGDWTSKELLSAIVRLTGQQLAYNLVVTNVPGPRVPVYLLGARLVEIYPLVPLFANQGLGIALFSYDGRLFWGLDADWERLPDLHDVVLALQHEFAAICAL
ncbi:MAG: wax ester/triacylglycerol synthase family O-acyltransferase [Myxococcota bacterium]|nr:wax ester/triacylglycerol synthase family O-acyltransferase [Myxococcota bacterium]